LSAQGEACAVGPAAHEKRGRGRKGRKGVEEKG
jgi:hypothetical protein